MLTKIFKYIVSYLTVIIAIGYFIYITFNNTEDIYSYMILSLLILIATSFVLDMMDEERKWKNIEKQMLSRIASVSDCRIQIFNNTKEWVDAINALTESGNHSFDSAALDKATRSKAKPQYTSIWGYLEKCSREDRILFRHILRVRKNNFENLLNRMLAGGANRNSYFAYYKLPPNFSFPTFGIIDNQYVVTRSPYQQGETPCYMIIDNEYISNYFIKYFEDLWNQSHKVDKVSVISTLYRNFKSEYDETQQQKLKDKINKIAKEGIIDDI